MRKTNRLLRVLGAFLLLIVGAQAVVVLVNFRTRRDGDALLQSARSIMVGKSTRDDLLPIVARFASVPGGSSSACAADESYSIRIGNNTLNRLGATIPALRAFGIRPATVAAMFLLQKGQVCYAYYSFAVLPGTSAQDLVVESSEGLFNCNDAQKYDPRESCYDVGEGVVRDTQKITARLSSQANLEERQHALAFDLACLTLLRGCQRLCQMNPALWKDYVTRARAQGWVLPPEEMSDATCTAIEHSASKG